MNSSGKKIVFLLITLSVGLFIYTCFRAFILSFTWDESKSFLDFVRKGEWYPEKFGILTANNHLLNTCLSWVTWNLFGSGEFSLRIPNLIAHILYLSYSAKLAYRIKNSVLSVCFFIALNFNPYLLDFFSLHRGYGLSYGLLMGGFWYLYSFICIGNRQKDAILSLFFSGLATLAHLALVNVMIAVYICTLILNLRLLYSAHDLNFSRLSFKRVLPGLLVFILFLSVNLHFGLNLKKEAALFYGGNTGIWHDTVLTLCDRLLYEMPYTQRLKIPLAIFFCVSFLSVLSFFFFHLRRKPLSHDQRYLLGALSIFSFALFSTFFLNKIFDTKYLIDRTALFLVIPFFIVLFFLWNEFKKHTLIINTLALALSGATLIHFSFCFNLKYVLEWKVNANAKEIISMLEAIHFKDSKKEKLNVGANFHVCIPLYYYRSTRQLDWLNLFKDEDAFNQLNNYYYLSQRFSDRLSTDSVEVLQNFSFNKTVFVKNSFEVLKEVSVYKKLDFDNEPKDSLLNNGNTTEEIAFSGRKCGWTDKDTEYSGGITYLLDSLHTTFKNSMISISAMVNAVNLRTVNPSFVISFESEKGNYSWQSLEVQDYLYSPSKWFKVSFTSFVPKDTKPGDKVSVYLWNQDGSKIYIDDLEFKWINCRLVNKRFGFN